MKADKVNLAQVFEEPVQYRMPSVHPTYNLATSRDHFYGNKVRAQDEADLPVVIQLLNDAIAREE